MRGVHSVLKFLPYSLQKRRRFGLEVSVFKLRPVVARFSGPIQTSHETHPASCAMGRLRSKCDGTRAETRFRLSAKRTSLFKSAGASVQSTTGSRGVRISGSDAGCTMFRGSVKSTGYPLHLPVSPSLHLPCIVCHNISTGLYQVFFPGVKRLGNGADHLPPPNAGLVWGWSHTCTSSLCLLGTLSEITCEPSLINNLFMSPDRVFSDEMIASLLEIIGFYITPLDLSWLCWYLSSDIVHVSPIVSLNF